MKTIASVFVTVIGLAAVHAAAADDIPMYVKLASIDAGRVVQATSPESQRAKAALQRASASCSAPNGIENQVGVIRRDLAERGVATSNVELLEAVAGVLLGATPKPDCASVLAAYATIRTSGKPEMSTHTDAVLGLRGLARAGMLGFKVDEQAPKIAAGQRK